MDHRFVALVLLSALLHAVWNAFLHVSEDRVVQLGTMSLPYLAAGLAGALLLPLPPAAAWPYVAASALLELGYCAALLRAYRRGEFSEIYPIARGLSPLLVAGLAFALLGERPTPAALAGIAWVYLLWNAPQLALICALRGPRTLLATRGALGRGMLAGTLALSAYAIVTLAYRHLPVATVSALRETSPIFALAIGWFALRERPTARRLVACALVVAGAALIRL